MSSLYDHIVQQLTTGKHLQSGIPIQLVLRPKVNLQLPRLFEQPRIGSWVSLFYYGASCYLDLVMNARGYIGVKTNRSCYNSVSFIGLTLSEGAGGKNLQNRLSNKLFKSLHI